MLRTLSRHEFVEELNKIIDSQKKKQAVDNALDNYVKGFFHSVPDVNEERAIKYLSALIGLEITDDSPLMDWYYSPSRNGRINEDFIVSVDEEKYALMTPEDFYDFYIGERND
jgi:hypothetical protein